MASLTIRNIPDEIKRQFRRLAATHGRSMEEEARQLILTATGAAGISAVRERQSDYAPPKRSAPAEEDDDWVHELIELAAGAGEGVFDREPQPFREFDL